jgi:hypothetical protein
MPLVTVVTGLLLIALGLAGKFGTGTPSNTPLYFAGGCGLGFVVLGLLGFRAGPMRKHVMHAAAMLGLLGFLGGAWRGWPHLPTLLSGGTPVRTLPDGTHSDMTGAVIVASLMGLICLVFVGLCVNSFIQARRRRQAVS